MPRALAMRVCSSGGSAATRRLGARASPCCVAIIIANDDAESKGNTPARSSYSVTPSE